MVDASKLFFSHASSENIDDTIYTQNENLHKYAELE